MATDKAKGKKKQPDKPKATPAKKAKDKSSTTTATTKITRKKSTVEITDDAEKVPEEEEGEVDDVDWTTDLTWKLVNGIIENDNIKEGLFPSPGANKSISRGGSRNKTDYHWALARYIFKNDVEYSALFARATASAEQKAWGRKIKNRLSRLQKDTRKFMTQMGQTGMGIMKESDLDMSLSNHITNCWTQIKEKQPWYWVMKGIISERPNLVPAGIGNNETGYDLGILQSADMSEGTSGDWGSIEYSIDDEEDEDEDEDQGEAEGAEEAEIEIEDGDDGEGEGEEGKDKSQKDTERKRKRSDGGDKKKAAQIVLDEKKPTGPRSGKSTPAKPTSCKKAKSGIDRFANIAAAEEETTQKALEVKKTKAQGETEKAIARVKAQAEVQMNKDRLRAEYAQKKLELELQFQFKMAQSAQPQVAHPPHATFSMSQFSPSNFSVSQHGSQHEAYPYRHANQTYNSYLSNSGQWQTNMPSSSSSSSGQWGQHSMDVTSSSPSVASASTSASAPASVGPPSNNTTSTSASGHLTFTQQLNDTDDDMYANE